MKFFGIEKLKFKKPNSGTQKPHFVFGSDADRDWKTLNLSVLILTFILAVSAALVFFGVWKSNKSAAYTPAQFEFINKKNLSTLIDESEKKAIEFERYKSLKPETTDPAR